LSDHAVAATMLGIVTHHRRDLIALREITCNDAEP
jgi:hypothetical protein